MTRNQFLDKIEYEGGIIEALIWGLKSTDCDDPYLRRIWQSIERWYHDTPDEYPELEDLLEARMLDPMD